MEACAAVALAGNIFQFIELGIKIFSKGQQLKRSADGCLKEHGDLDAICKDLNGRLELLETTENASPTLQELATRCREVGLELRGKLEKVKKQKSKNQVWSSYLKALRCVWSDGAIKERAKRLDALRSEVCFHLQTLLPRNIAELSGLMQSLESRFQNTESSLSGLWSAQKHNFEKISLNAKVISSSILDKLNHFTEAPGEIHNLLAQLQPLLVNVIEQLPLRRAVDVRKNLPTPEEFLETFKFRAMGDRHDAIPSAHRRTYEWLLRGIDYNIDGTRKSLFHKERHEMFLETKNLLAKIGVTESQTSRCLPPHLEDVYYIYRLQNWLRNGTGVFWIWGKPGCGKSTLLKAMNEKECLGRDLRDLLNAWSSGHTLVTASFYLFRAASYPLQKSPEGMLQSLLYQILHQKPDLISLLFDSKAQRAASARSLSSERLDDAVWSVAELMQAFRRLGEITSVRVYLHIDGLDEMDTSAKDIATTICDIVHMNSNIKILAAGRWRPEFLDAFGTENSLNLHELTQLDISKYCIEKLNQSCIWQVLDDSDQFADIIIEIVSAAEGVFLWVYLVVELVLDGCQHFENYARLKKRLLEYPRDLDKLYHFLFNDIDPRYREDASFWLLTIYIFSIRNKRIKDSFQLNLMILELAERFQLDDVFSIWRLSKNPIGEHEKCKRLQQRMIRQCPHFFQFRPKSHALKRQRIEFTHRTVLDFFDQQHVVSELTAVAKERDPVLAVFAAQFTIGYGSFSPTVRPLQGLYSLMAATQPKLSALPPILDAVGVEKFFKQDLHHFTGYDSEYDLGHALCFCEATIRSDDEAIPQGTPLFSDKNLAYSEALQRVELPPWQGVGALLRAFVWEKVRKYTIYRLMEGSQQLEGPNETYRDLHGRNSHLNSRTLACGHAAINRAWECTLTWIRAQLVGETPRNANNDDWIGYCKIEKCSLFFLNQGADPDQLCPAIPEDPDSSNMTLLSMLKRVGVQKDALHSNLLDELILLVKEWGGIEIREHAHDTS